MPSILSIPSAIPQGGLSRACETYKCREQQDSFVERRAIMIETKTQQASSIVQDPVCGITIDPAWAFATRRLAEETFYFCSQRCVQQFDREHTGSATTGVSEAG